MRFRCALTTTRPRLHTHPHQSGADPSIFFWARIASLQKTNRSEIRSRVPNGHMSKLQWSAPDSETSHTFANPQHTNTSTALAVLRICKKYVFILQLNFTNCTEVQPSPLCQLAPTANAVGITSQRQLRPAPRLISTRTHRSQDSSTGAAKVTTTRSTNHDHQTPHPQKKRARGKANP